ncbi:MAG TPA: glycosyltransferase family 87 protein [Anaerolineae bacterium]|nr:glycosyltransferase family 87 protein [Anaerolineae bacterium]
MRRLGSPHIKSVFSQVGLPAALLVVGWLFLAQTVVPAAGQLTHGFSAYYTAGRVVLAGEPGARLYDEAWFADRVTELSGGQARDIFLATPPASAVLWLPLALLPIEAARIVWTWLNVALLALALGLIAHELRVGWQSIGFVGLAALFTLAAPVREQFQLGQMYVLLLWLHTIGWRAFIHERDRVAGIMLGLALALKFSGWPIGLVLLAYRRWRAAGWAAVTVFAVVLFTLPFVGWEAWRECLFVEVPAVVRSAYAPVPAYQTTTGFWQHLFRYDPLTNPGPIADILPVAIALTLLTTVAAVWAVLKWRDSASASFAAAVALTELLSPAAEQYHYVLLLLPLAVLWHAVWLRRSIGLLFGAMAATFLIAWPLAYKDPAAATGWNALLHYPRLYGGWVVFGALITLKQKLHSDST